MRGQQRVLGGCVIYIRIPIASDFLRLEKIFKLRLCGRLTRKEKEREREQPVGSGIVESGRLDRSKRRETMGATEASMELLGAKCRVGHRYQKVARGRSLLGLRG